MNNELLYEPKYLENLYKLENNTHPEKSNWISKHVHVKKLMITVPTHNSHTQNSHTYQNSQTLFALTKL